VGERRTTGPNSDRKPAPPAGLQAALLDRARTGQGLHLEVSMLRAALDLQLEILTYFLNGARMEKSPTSLASMFHPGPYGVYATKDGGWVAISASTQTMTERLFAAIGRADLNENPDFKTNSERIKRRREVDAIVGGWIKERTLAENIAFFEEAGVTAAPVYDIGQFLEDPHVQERGIVFEAPDVLDRVEEHGDLFADVARFADGQNVLIREKRSPGALDRVLRGHDGAHAGKLLGFADVDVADARVREGAAENFADEHARQINIGDELGIAGDLLEPLDALDPLPDDGEFFCFGHECFSVLFQNGIWLMAYGI